jgi:hypothetical protein
MNSLVRRCPVLVVAFVALAGIAGCARPDSTAVAHPVIDYVVAAEGSPQLTWQARYEAHPGPLPARAWSNENAKR